MSSKGLINGSISYSEGVPFNQVLPVEFLL